MATCPECGSIAPDSFGECPTCGATLNATFGGSDRTEPCSHCAEDISPDAEACPACGILRARLSCATHADRNAEGQCVVCGLAVCEECNRGGKHFLCDSHRTVSLLQGWAQVYSTTDDFEARLIADNLEAEGLDTRVLSQKDHFSIPVDIGDLSPVRVLVPAFLYTDATRVLAEHTNASGQVQFGEEEDTPSA